MVKRGAVGHIYSIAKCGKVFYVGQTFREPSHRWRQHIRSGKGLVGAALRMFGAYEDFEWDVIETVPEHMLDEREAHWISEHDTLYPNGLNMFSARAAGRPCEEVRKKMSEAAKRRWQDPEQRAILVEAAKNKNEDLERRQEILRKARASSTPEGRMRKSVAMRKRYADISERQIQAERSKRLWADPEFRRKQMAARAKRKGAL